MRKISQDEIKKIQLDMLIDFADFCDQNGITYYLSSGTLLGAIRHKGFIPWDDDIDIMLPRPDYEKAMSLYHSERYFLDSISVDPDSICRCGRMNCSNTILKSNLKKKYQTQVFIDVFPIDGITSNKLFQKLKLSIIQIMINFHMSTITAYQSTKHYADKEAGLFNYKQYVRTLGKFILISTVGHSSPQFWIKCINNWLKKTNFATADVVGFFAGGYYGMREIMDRDIFCGKVRIEFEGHQFWAPSGYDRYLRNLYGNYMKLPPPEKRQSHHDFEAYWIK